MTQTHLSRGVYKCIFGLSPSNMSNLFVMIDQVHNVNTRQAAANNVVVPNYRLQSTRRDFAYRGPFYWQLLDQDIRDAASFGQFKGTLNRSDTFT